MIYNSQKRFAPVTLFLSLALLFVVKTSDAFVIPTPTRSTTATILSSYKQQQGHSYLSFSLQQQKQNVEKDGQLMNKKNKMMTSISSFVFGIWMMAASSSSLLIPTSAYAAEEAVAPTPVATTTNSGPRIVGQLKGSGLVFKDTLQIESFDDPKVQGVTLYISSFQRPLTERLTSSFMTEPGDASVGCAKTNPKVVIADTIAMGPGGEEVFKENKSILFKSLRVQRIYDKEKNTMVYVSFNTRLDKNDDTNKSRFKSSLCAVNLD